MSNLKKQLERLDVSKLKMKNGSSVEKELKEHSKILADCIMESLDRVYESYNPSVYRRTYGLYDSLYIDNKIRIDVSAKGVSLSIRLSFDDGANHPNFYGESSNVANLINEGWKWRNDVNIPYLSERSGTHFIEDGIEEYKRRVKNSFAVRFTINDEIRMF